MAGIRGFIALIVLGIVLLALPLLGVPRDWLLYIFLFFIYLTLANMWNLLAGYSGLISLCQPAFIGLAGYGMVIVTWNDLPFWVGIISGAVVAAIFAVIIAFPTFRMKGIYFAIASLIIPEIFRLLFLIWRPVGNITQGKGSGYLVKGLADITPTHTYWMAVVIGVLSIIVVRYVLRSKLGLGLAAIRDNDMSSASSGVDVFRVKLTVFTIAAILTGIAGAIYYIYQGSIEPTSAFSIKWTMTAMLGTIIGGIAIEEGPIIGTVIVTVLYFALSQFGNASLLVQGVILVVIMLAAPHGIMGSVRMLDLGRFLRREPRPPVVDESAG